MGPLDPCVLKTREKFREISEGLGNVFREGSTRVDVPTAQEARESFRAVLQEVRTQGLLANQSLETVISFLSLSHRLEVIADDLDWNWNPKQKPHAGHDTFYLIASAENLIAKHCEHRL